MPKKRPPPPPPSPPPQTRARNKDVHPGIVDKPSARRSSEVVRAEHEEQLTAKVLKEKRRQEALAAVALYENDAAMSRRMAEEDGGNPPLRKLPARAARPQSQMHLPVAQGSPDSDNITSQASATRGLPWKESDDSSDEYEGPEDGEDGDEDTSKEDDMELDPEELEDGDTSTAPRQQQKKARKKNKTSRLLVQELRKDLGNSLSNKERGKRRDRGESVSDAPSQNYAQKKRRHTGKAAAGGLKDSWDASYYVTSGRSSSPVSQPPLTDNDTSSDGLVQDDSTFADEDMLPPPALPNTQGIRSDVSMQLTWKQSHAPPDRRDRSLIAPGDARVNDSADELEARQRKNVPESAAHMPQAVHTYIRQVQNQSSAQRAKTIKSQSSRRSREATVVADDASQIPRGKTKSSSKRVRYATRDIPIAMQKDWTEVMVPAAREMAGRNDDPWAPLTVEEVQNLMDQVFPLYREVYTVEKDDMFCFILNSRLRKWRSGFGAAGLQAVKLHMTTFQVVGGDGKRTPEAVAREALGLLSRIPGQEYDEDVEYSKNKPFFWREWEEREGPFANEMIAWTFYWHLQSIRDLSIPDEYPGDSEWQAMMLTKIGKYPVGAVILSILAVERALKTWVTGEHIALDSVNPGHWFSADNWGDYIKQKGLESVKMKRTSTFVKPLQNLTHRDWFNIFDTAVVIRADFPAGQRRSKRAKRAVPGTGGALDNSEEPVSDVDGELDLFG